MLDNPILDVTFGLIFVYVILSLVCSAVQEWVASVFALRSKNLDEGIRNLVGDDLAKKVFGHRLIKGLGKPKRLPSYISAETFSTVLLEVVAKDNAKKSYADLTTTELKKMIEAIPKKDPARDVVATLVGAAKNDLDALKAEVAGWFDEGMERIGGWYRRSVKYWLLGIAAAVAVVTNANTLQIVAGLWENDALRTSIAAQAQAAATIEDASKIEAVGDQLKDFPIGWTGSEAFTSPLWWASSLVGWLLTVAAVSLGAPFWFDLLGKVGQLRASGGKPETRARPA